MAFKLDRDFYRPRVSAGYTNIRLEEPADLPGAEIWRFEDGSRYLLKVFGGKRRKPDEFVSFKSPEFREAYLRRWLEGQRENQKAKAKRAAERTGYTALKVGDVLYASWGYEQTNVNFYQVVARRGKRDIQVRPIAQESVYNTRGGSESVVALPDNFRDHDGLLDNGNNDGGGAPTWKRARRDSIYLTDYADAYLWDGKPKHQTAPGWGH